MGTKKWNIVFVSGAMQCFRQRNYMLIGKVSIGLTDPDVATLLTAFKLAVDYSNA